MKCLRHLKKRRRRRRREEEEEKRTEEMRFPIGLNLFAWQVHVKNSEREREREENMH